jgi:hypothetical protein
MDVSDLKQKRSQKPDTQVQENKKEQQIFPSI